MRTVKHTFNTPIKTAGGGKVKKITIREPMAIDMEGWEPEKIKGTAPDVWPIYLSRLAEPKIPPESFKRLQFCEYVLLLDKIKPFFDVKKPSRAAI